jgi:HEAT repeat protein
MRTVILSLLFATTLAAQNFQKIHVQEQDAAGGLANAIARLPQSAPTWAAWTVPATAGRSVWCDRCTLEGRYNNFNISDDDEMPFTKELLIVTRIEDGRIRRVRFYNATCPIEGRGDTVHLLKNVRTSESVSVLRASLRDASKEGEIIAAISMHDDPGVTPLLIDLARHDPSTEIRRSSLFWLGQKAGDKAAGELRHAVDHDPDERVKEQAVFAISQLPEERSVPMLMDLVKTHKNAAVRKRAMFWLAQTNDPRALDLMEQILLR